MSTILVYVMYFGITWWSNVHICLTTENLEPRHHTAVMFWFSCVMPPLWKYNPAVCCIFVAYKNPNYNNKLFAATLFCPFFVINFTFCMK